MCVTDIERSVHDVKTNRMATEFLTINRIL